MIAFADVNPDTGKHHLVLARWEHTRDPQRWTLDRTALCGAKASWPHVWGSVFDRDAGGVFEITDAMTRTDGEYLDHTRANLCQRCAKRAS